MIKKLLLAMSLVPTFVEAASPPGDPQIYPLAGGHKGQVVMLSNWPEGKVFSEYEDHRKSTGDYFQPGQPVWVWCGGAATRNKVATIHTSRGGMEITTLTLERDPGCTAKPWLLSNHEFPKQQWRAAAASTTDIEAIRARLVGKADLAITRITTDQKRVLFLVLDPGIPAIHATGGYRLLDDRLNEIATLEQAPLTPLIDLDGDGVPEFFIPSSDGMGAWLYRLFPAVDTEMSVYYKGSQ